jgi:hypothetical protein
VGLMLWFAHRAVFRQQDKVKREILLGILSVELATILDGMLFGSHLGVFPINILFYLLASFLFTAGRSSDSETASVLDSLAPAVTRRAGA